MGAGGKAKAGRKGKQAAGQESDRDEEETETLTKAHKPGRKGKQMPSDAPADGQKHKATAAPVKRANKAQQQQQQPVKRSKQALSGDDSGQHTKGAVSSLPASKGKAQPAKRGRKALTDNRAEQGKDDTTSDAAATAVDEKQSVVSPRGRKGGVATGHQKVTPKGKMPVSKGQKAVLKGQAKAVPTAKSKQAPKRQQPR